MGDIDKSIRGKAKIADPAENRVKNQESRVKMRMDSKLAYKLGEMIATRKAYGEALVRIGGDNQQIVALDAEVKNSTFAELFKDKYPERFYEMFIAEQNMVGAALGLSKMGKVPFVSTFAVFFTRAFDQIRMSAISHANVKFCGSHAGVSIGQDGPSQMGLEDLAMFRTIPRSIVFCPADAVSTQRLVEIAAQNQGIFYIRTQRPPTPVIYESGQKFKIGGSNTLKSSESDKLTIVACGIALSEALKAADTLAKERINVRVIDAYSIKPIDEQVLIKAARETGQIITCEDHYLEGGLGDAVLNALSGQSAVKVHKMGVFKMPMSGTTEDLISYEELDSGSIARKVFEILK